MPTCNATYVDYLHGCCRLFGRLNSRSPFAVGSKGAITRDNILEVEAYFVLAEEELRGLTDFDGQPLLHGIHHTFITGYISDMKVALGLAKDLFNESLTNTYLLLYRMSQDAIEHFFGDIRSRGYWCQNPTAQYFMYSYRALVSNRLQLLGPSEGRNCTDPVVEEVVNSSNTAVLPSPSSVDEDDGIDQQVENLYWSWIHRSLMHNTPSEWRLNMLYYMSGWAARQVCTFKNRHTDA